MIEVEWMRLKAADLRALAAKDAIVIVPVASVEQHGPHLPVSVDTLIASDLARRAAQRIAGEHPVVVAPAIWCGLAEHHMPFGATFTLDFPTFHALIRCICRSLVRHGFRRIMLLNGHGGNIIALKTIVGELTIELGAPIATATYWPLAREAIAPILERQTSVNHACEAETSMILAIAPDLVDVSRLGEAKGGMGPDPVARLGDGVYRWRSFAARTDTGVIGDAELASAEKGERLLEAATAALVKALLTPELWVSPR